MGAFLGHRQCAGGGRGACIRMGQVTMNYTAACRLCAAMETNGDAGRQECGRAVMGGRTARSFATPRQRSSLVAAVPARLSSTHATYVSDRIGQGRAF